MPRPVLQVLAPFAGTVADLAEIADPVYADGVVGRGVALRPRAGQVVVTAPCAGLVHAMLPHAVMVAAESGRSVLVHLPSDASRVAAVGDRVVAGTPLLTWVAEPDALVPVLALQAPVSDVLAVVEAGDEAGRGQPLLFWS